MTPRHRYHIADDFNGLHCTEQRKDEAFGTAGHISVQTREPVFVFDSMAHHRALECWEVFGDTVTEAYSRV